MVEPYENENDKIILILVLVLILEFGCLGFAPCALFASPASDLCDELTVPTRRNGKNNHLKRDGGVFFPSLTRNDEGRMINDET